MDGRVEECSSFQVGRGAVLQRRWEQWAALVGGIFVEQRTFLSPGGRGGAAPPLSFFNPGPGDDARFGAMAAEGSR